MTDMLDFFRKTSQSSLQQDFRRNVLWGWIERQLIAGRVLDIGGGAGYMACRAAESGYQTILAEPDGALLAAGQEQINAAGGLLTVLEKSAHEIDPDEIGRFENILLLDVLEHIEDDLTALRNVTRLLAENGQIIITVPALPFLYGKRDEQFKHYRRYTSKTLRRLLEAVDLEIAFIRWWNLLGVFPYFFYEKILQRPISDQIREKPGGPLQRAARSFLYYWLRAETHLPLPVGLTLMAVVQAKTKDAEGR